jgi:hypothetical protein
VSEDQEAVCDLCGDTYRLRTEVAIKANAAVIRASGGAYFGPRYVRVKVDAPLCPKHMAEALSLAAAEAGRYA